MENFLSIGLLSMWLLSWICDVSVLSFMKKQFFNDIELVPHWYNPLFIVVFPCKQFQESVNIKAYCSTKIWRTLNYCFGTAIIVTFLPSVFCDTTDIAMFWKSVKNVQKIQHKINRPYTRMACFKPRAYFQIKPCRKMYLQNKIFCDMTDMIWECTASVLELIQITTNIWQYARLKIITF